MKFILSASSALKIPACESQFAEPTLPDDVGHALERTEVRHHGHTGFRIEKTASCVASRMSQAQDRSTPPPMQNPWIATMTGLRHSSTAVKLA